jgi:hypothetical protein
MTDDEIKSMIPEEIKKKRAYEIGIRYQCSDTLKNYYQAESDLVEEFKILNMVHRGEVGK